MTRFDRFQVHKKLGAGGLADVFEATLSPDAEPILGLDPGQPVALKILRDPGRSASTLRRFMREGRLLRRLAHPGLPACLHVQGGHRPYITLERLHGQTLSERLRENGPLSPEDGIWVAKSILEVLSWLHTHGVFHRDVKSSNIFVCDGGRVLLLDLGLAVDPSDRSDSTLGEVMGTYAYMAPEQIAGALVDHRADLYALGITLYEALSGKRPYRARGPGGYLKAHTRGGAPQLGMLAPGLPPRLLDLVERLMARDPAARPQTASVALAQLTGAPSTRHALAPPPLVGRAAARGAVEAVIDQPGTLQIVGEPGMGTARIARLAWALAGQRGLSTLGLRCLEQGDPLAPLTRLAEELAIALGREVELGDVRSALGELAGEGRLLLVAEDLHLAPAVLARRVKAFGDLPNVSLVSTGVEPVEALGGHVVSLRPLRTDEVGRIVGGMLGTRVPPRGLADRLWRFSGGLPAAVVFSVRDFFDRDVLRFEGIGDEGEPRWTMASSVRMQNTTSLRELFQDRLERLELPERQLVELLAVAGGPLPLAVAARALGHEDDGQAAHRLQALHLARVEAGDRVELARPALGALVRVEVGEARERALHAALADALELEPPGAWRDLALAHHRAHAAEAGERAGALAALGEQLVEDGRPKEALAVLTRAVHAPGVEGEIAARVGLARGEVLLALGERRSALDSLGAGLRMAEDLGDLTLRARARVGHAEARAALGELERAQDWGMEALDLAERLRGSQILPRVLLVLGHVELRRGRRSHAAAHFGRCLELGMRMEWRRYAAKAHGGVGRLHAEDGRLGAALRHLAQEHAWARESGTPLERVEVICAMADVRAQIGDIHGAEELLAEGDRVSETAGHIHAAWVGTGRARARLICGDAAGAIELLDKHLVAGSDGVHYSLRCRWRSTRVAARLRLGDTGAALATANVLADDAKQIGWEQMAVLHQGIVAVLRAAGDELADAVDILLAMEAHRDVAELLLLGEQLGEDPLVQDTAVQQARDSGDVELLCRALMQRGRPDDQAEASLILDRLEAGASGDLAARLRARRAAGTKLGVSPV